MTWHIAYAAGARSDYGIVRRYLQSLSQREEIDLEILVTGSLLSEEYGHGVSRIEEDGFPIGCRMDIDVDSGGNDTVIHSMARAMDGFGRHFAEHHYDLLILLGDRYEIFAVAAAAAMSRVPILHLHGGEATFANTDEFLRHSITKMSLYHFASTEAYRQRIIQMGEAPDRVFYLGALGAENALLFDESRIDPMFHTLAKKDFLLVLFHPETLTDEAPERQTAELLAALDEIHVLPVFLGTNADAGGKVIRRMIRDFVDGKPEARYYEDLSSDAYHYLLKNALCLVGNSSSGLIEAPSLKTLTVNIGHRQDGRIRGKSVIDVSCQRDEIASAIRRVTSGREVFSFENPYYRPEAAKNYTEMTLHLLNRLDKETLAKTFYDIPTL